MKVALSVCNTGFINDSLISIPIVTCGNTLHKLHAIVCFGGCFDEREKT